MKCPNLVVVAMISNVLLAPLPAIAAEDGGLVIHTADAHQKVRILEVIVSNGGILGDFAGPAEVFREAADQPFRIKYVAATLDPVTLKGGMRIVPDYSFQTAPRPDYVLMGSQGTRKPPSEVVAWLRGLYKNGSTLVSVCTGVDWLAYSGLLENKTSASPHLAIERLQKDHPGVQLVTGKRFVDSDPQIFTGGAFFSGMDLALHILDERYGRDVAQRTADRLEYRGTAWITNENDYSADAGK